MSVSHKRLGKHGVLVSNLCLGTMNFGWHTSEEDSFAIMERALELGINFFDTADVYGWSVEHGLTEEIIGRWFAQGGGRRDAVVLATKVFNPVDRKANLPEVNSDGRSLSAYKIRKHCEGSLKRLQTDWIDLYQMHHIDRACPWDEDLAGLRRAGQAREGRLRRFQQFRRLGHRHRLPGSLQTGPDGTGQRAEHLPSGQPHDRAGGDSRLPPLWPGADPLEPSGRRAIGRSAAKNMNSGRRTNEDFAKEVEAKRGQLEKYESLCREIGHPPGEVALAWLLHNPVVTAPIIGPRTLEQLESAVRAASIQLDDETLKALDAIFPGPGGEAPKAYAW